MKNPSADKNIKVVIINKEGIDIDKIYNIMSKYEELDITGIINPINQRERDQYLRRVPLWKGKSITILNPSDIIYLVAKGGQVAVVTSTERYLTNHSLNYWEEKLKDLFFFRCHKSYLVNMERIKEVKPFFDNTYIISFEGLKDEVTVSRSYVKEFRQILYI